MAFAGCVVPLYRAASDMQSRPPLPVRGYQGASLATAETILGDRFLPSNNSYDWLGTGIYFWQDAPRRAPANGPQPDLWIPPLCLKQRLISQTVSTY